MPSDKAIEQKAHSIVSEFGPRWWNEHARQFPNSKLSEAELRDDMARYCIRVALEALTRLIAAKEQAEKERASFRRSRMRNQTMPGDKAIEAAARELADADARDFDTQPQSFRDGDIQLAKFVLAAAYAIDGDFNAGVEAVAAKVESEGFPWFGGSRRIASEIRKLKR